MSESESRGGAGPATETRRRKPAGKQVTVPAQARPPLLAPPRAAPTSLAIALALGDQGSLARLGPLGDLGAIPKAELFFFLFSFFGFWVLGYTP